MKTCKNCKSPFAHIELFSIIRGYAIVDVFRFLILLGQMLSLFHACTNLHPAPPLKQVGKAKQQVLVVDYVLYFANRSELSHTELDMLANIQKSCGKEYRDQLPEIWADGQPTLYKMLYLQGISMVLPLTSAISFLMLQKKDAFSSVLAATHFVFEIVSIILSLFGAYFSSDARLCFLGHFSRTWSMSVLLWTFNICFAIFYKAGILFALELYIKSYCKTKTFVHLQLTPSEELKSYLQELRELGITPKVNIDIPDDVTKRDWEFVNSTTKRMLQDVRIQMAELHRDDPLVDDLLKSGKLQGLYRGNRKRTGSSSSAGGTGPSVLRIARMMASKNAEYKLLKQHQKNLHHHHGHGTQPGESRDDVEIILPEPNFRFDPDY